MRAPSSHVVLALLGAAALTACATGIRTNVVAEAPPVPEDREIRFLEEDVACETTKVGDIRVPASAWPSVRPDAKEKVREMGGEAVLGWRTRKVMVGGRGTGVPGGGAGPREEAFWFGVVVRFPEACPDV